MRRVLVLCLVVVLALALAPGTSTASTAASASTDLAGASLASQSSPDGTTTVQVGVAYTGVLVGSQIRVEAVCYAVGTGAVAATEVESCTLTVGGTSTGSQGAALPGPVSVLVTSAAGPLGPIRACVTGRAVPVFGEDATASTCVDSAVTSGPDNDLRVDAHWVGGSGGPSSHVCTALATPFAAETRITECTVQDGDFPRTWDAPTAEETGPFAMTSGMHLFVLPPAGNLEACVSAEALYLDGTTLTERRCFAM